MAPNMQNTGLVWENVEVMMGFKNYRIGSKMYLLLLLNFFLW